MTFNANKIDYFTHDRLKLFQSLMNFLKLTEGLDADTDKSKVEKALRESELHEVIGNLALGQRNKEVEEYFRFVIDQPVYNSADYIRLRRLIVNWYASLRTLNVNQRNATNPFFLSSNELDELIKSFGFPHSGKIIGRVNKINFLYNIIDFYKQKGSPHIFTSALKFFGFKDVVLSEWWTIENPSTLDIEFRSKPIIPRHLRKNALEITTKDYNTFFTETDPLWQLTEADIKALQLSETIKLPSLTPYISARATYNVSKVISALTIITRKFKESYEFWITYVLRPQGSVMSYLNDPSDPGVSVDDKYLVGSVPIGIFIGKEDQIAERKSSGWVFEIPENQDAIIVESTNTHHVYNTNNWVDLTVLLTSGEVGKNQGLDRPKILNREVVLNGFEGVFSFMEISLAIDYLFASSSSTPDTSIYQYNGSLAPLDKGIYGLSGISGTSGYRDDIDDQDYEPIIEDYRKLTERPMTREIRDTRYARFQTDFTGSVDYTDNDNFVTSLDRSSIFLEAMNYNLKDAIDQKVIINSNSAILESIFFDFEHYLMFEMQILEVPITYMVLGMPLKTRLKEVVDFFKPLRVRLLEFTAHLEIGNPLEDSQLEKDSLFTTLTNWYQDKGPWEFDQGLVKDSMLISDVHRFNLSLARDGTTPISLFDRSWKDAMNNFIYENISELLRDTNNDSMINTSILYLRDDCPGDLEFMDSSTVTDSVGISVNII